MRQFEALLQSSEVLTNQAVRGLDGRIAGR